MGKRSRAIEAPRTTIPGAPSPPMASRATVMRWDKGFEASGKRSSWSGLGRDDFAAVVVSAGAANMVRPLALAAIRALDHRCRLQRMVRAAHIATRFRGFLLRNR